MSNQVAQIILGQLGGNRFAVMTGAKNFASHGTENALSFRLPGTMTKNKCNYVKITLNGSDLYDVYFGRIRKDEMKEVGTFSGVYAEDLVNLFETATGLFTHL